MLELQKLVLQQVSDTKSLFRKELQKSLRWLDCHEIEILQDWVIQNFGNRYQDVINEVFELT
jgi:hypothetical protein